MGRLAHFKFLHLCICLRPKTTNKLNNQPSNNTSFYHFVQSNMADTAIPKEVESEHGLVFFGNEVCPFAQRVWWTLKEKNIPFSYVHIPLGPEKPLWYGDNIYPQHPPPPPQTETHCFVDLHNKLLIPQTPGDACRYAQKVNPRGTVPTIRHDGKLVLESVIYIYIYIYVEGPTPTCLSLYTLIAFENSALS